MGHRVEARQLAVLVGTELGLTGSDLLRFFGDAPLDFPVTFSGRLPFLAHRFGMVGITLGGKVRLLEKSRNSSPPWFLSLLRHEAEHVRQQRKEPILFYPRYLLFWLAKLLHPFPSDDLRSLRRRYGLFYAAYRAIPYEIDAYREGDGLAERLKSIGTEPEDSDSRQSEW